MRVSILAVCTALAATTSLAAYATPPTATHVSKPVARSDQSNPERAAEIFAADLGTIKTWKPEGKDAMLVESVHGDWYRATFWGPCDDLNYSNSIGFVTSPNGNLDRFSSIVVGQQECTFKTFTKVAMPETGKPKTTAAPAKPTPAS